jgi:hypothetical protein
MGERRMRAPYGGKIVAVGLNAQGLQSRSTLRPRIGDVIPALTPVVVIAKPEPLEIVVTPDQRRSNELAVGEPVTVSHSAARSRPFVSQITAMPLTALGSGAVVPSPQAIRIALPPDAPPVTIGDFVNIDVVNKIHSDTLFLPPAAIRSFVGRDFVVIQEGGKQRRVDVTKGLTNETQVEILSGLHEGDIVVGQ